MNKLLIVMLLVLVAIPMVNAQVYKQWEEVDVKVPCINNGTYCSSAATCAFTILYPDNTPVVNNLNGTNQGSFHNYTLNKGMVSQTGEYDYYVSCTDGTLSGYYSDSFDVTPGGVQGQTTFYFLAIVIVYGLVAFGISKSDITLTLLGTFGLYFIGLWILFNGLDVYKNWFTEGFAWITLGAAFYVSIRMAHEYIIELKKNNLNWCRGCNIKGHKRGFVLTKDKTTIHYDREIGTRATLHGAFHEIGHCLNNEKGLRSFEKEIKAEEFANNKFKEWGLSIPRKTRALGKSYIRRKKRHGDNIKRGRR